MKKSIHKKQILKDVYRENLWVVGKAARPSRRCQENAHPKSKFSKQFTLIAIVCSVISISAVVSAWHLPIDTGAGNSLSQQQLMLANEDFETLREEHATAASSTEATNKLAAKLTKKLYAVDDLNDLNINEFKIDNEPLNPEDLAALTQSDLPLAELFGLGVKTIVIDPGHGGKDPGAVGKNGLYEKDIALEIAKNLRDRLKKRNSSYRVILTRERDDHMSLNQRVAFANTNDADLFISIHVNYFPENPKTFVETYYFGPTTDSKVEQLASRENQGSNFPYADFKDLLQKIGDTLKFQESKQLAASVQSHLFHNMSKMNHNTSDHGIKSAPFVVLLGLDAPSILTEVTCICNSDEEQRLRDSEYRDNIAGFLENGIVSYLHKNTNVGGRDGGKKEKLAQAQ